MKKLRRRNQAEVFKIGKISKKLKNKKGHEINVSCARERKFYRKYSIQKKATQSGSIWEHELAQTNWMVLLLQMINGMQHMHAETLNCW